MTTLALEGRLALERRARHAAHEDAARAGGRDGRASEEIVRRVKRARPALGTRRYLLAPFIAFESDTCAQLQRVTTHVSSTRILASSPGYWARARALGLASELGDFGRLLQAAPRPLAASVPAG